MRGKQVLWGAPTFDQVRIGWNETKKAAFDVAKFNQTLLTCEFPTGGAIHFRSLDNPDNARGRTADGIVIDESADVSESAWYDVMRPMLIDTGGWAWAIGTPKGQNWFWREFLMAGERADSATWNAPTLGVEITPDGLIRKPHPLENPNIPFDEMMQLFRSLPDRVFRAEILGEFIEESGGVFRGVRDAINKERTKNEEPQPGRRYTLGTDLARVHDFTVLTVCDDTGRQVYHERFNQISWERQIARIVDVANRYGATVVIDSTGVGDPIFEAVGKTLRAMRSPARIEPFQFTNASKTDLIDNLAMEIEQRQVRLMDIPAQTNELLAYQYELTPSRNVRMNAPEGMFDDCVIALALSRYRPIPTAQKTVPLNPLDFLTSTNRSADSSRGQRPSALRR